MLNFLSLVFVIFQSASSHTFQITLRDPIDVVSLRRQIIELQIPVESLSMSRMNFSLQVAPTITRDAALSLLRQIVGSRGEVVQVESQPDESATQ